MHRSSESIASLAAALAKAQMELTNPEKSLTGTLRGNRPDEPGRTFRYASLSSGLDIVRKVLGQHEIATLQTTIIDQDIQTVSLTTVLAYSSGEWIASDWPVCTLSAVATPHHMGAALTYARRYGLFTLVGIAGEDDLDAPDLAGQPHEGPPKGGNGFDQAKFNRRGAAETGGGNLSAFTKSREPWTPPKQALAPEASAALRDQLLGELCELSSADEVTTWAQRALRAKSTLRDVDAAVVEAAFASRMAELGEGGPLPSLAEAGQDDLKETAAPPGRAQLMAALRASVELLPSALPLSEPRRYRDRAHLKFVASLPCLRCERQPAEPHHLRFVQPRALGRKVSDEFAVPLCRTHHREVHRHGDEEAWWKGAGIDAVAVAHRLWQHTRLDGAPIQEHVDPLLSPLSAQTVRDGQADPSAGPIDR
jgi:hypothetical protein